jgi:hypothetical protein
VLQLAQCPYVFSSTQDVNFSDMQETNMEELRCAYRRRWKQQAERGPTQ